MWPQHQANAISAQEVAAFGKMPWAGDFLQVGNPPGKEQLIDWLEQGIAVGASRGPDWKLAFESSGQKGFLFSSDERTLVAGVLAPSRDTVGRRFPFVTYSTFPVESLGANPHIAPLALGSFLHAAGTQVLALQAEQSSLVESISRLPVPDLGGLASHLEGFDSWAQGEPLRNAGQAIFGGQWREGLSHALFVTAESIRPFVSQENPPTPLSIRFPLGTGFAGAAVLWIQIVRLCAGWKTTIPTAIWSFESERSSLTVQLGPNSPHTFADIWQQSPVNENLYNLLDAEPVAELLAQSRPDLSRLIHSGEATVAELLAMI